uniref:F-box domain-containing protein n=1 Tax=Moniliophthora roreri TaxID=221103 RepID=A0A0W0GB91_MONRR
MLSQELIDLIIDELSCDKKALINVSSVSRSWVPRSRNHLFRTLHLLPVSRREAPRYLATGTMEYHTQEFIDLCSHPHSTISNAGPTHIKMTLSFYDRTRSLYTLPGYTVPAFGRLLSWLSERREGERGLTETNAHRLFWNVRHLTLLCIGSGESIEMLERVLLLSPFPRVTQLTLIDQSFRSRQSFSDVMSSFASLKHLAIDAEAFCLFPVFEHSSIDISFPLSLTHIEVPMPRTFLEVLRSCSTLHNLTTVIRCPNVESECIAINQFLESSAAVRERRLKHCKLVLRSSEYSMPPGVIYELSRFINFNKVQSWMIDTDRDAFVGGDIAMMPNVTTLVLHNFGNWNENFLQMATELDGVLSVQFPSLRVVKIPLYMVFERSILQRSGWDKVKKRVRKGSEAHRAMNEEAEKFRSFLPKCKEKGLLKMFVTPR